MDEQKKYWDEETLMTEVPKDNFSVYVVSACKKSGKAFVNIREWYWTSQDPTRKPGRNGLCVPMTNNGDACACLIASIQEARKFFEKAGTL